MPDKIIEIQVYGAETICSSCVGMPSSIETYEWLEAALSRKFPNQPLQFQYIDINRPKEAYREFAERVVEEDFFYPVVLIENEVVGEGSPRLRTIVDKLRQYGYKEEGTA